MKKNYLLFGVLLLHSILSLAQNNPINAVWITGASQNAIAFPQDGGHYVFPEPNELYTGGYENQYASVCDGNGNPLLVSDGTNAWSYNGSSYNLLTTELKAGGRNGAFLQNTIIVPRPNHPESYYVVTISGKGFGFGFGFEGANQGLYYSEFNTEGYFTSLNTPLLINGDSYNGSNTSNAITSTIHADGTNYWIVANIGWGNGTNSIIASYLVTENGIEQNTTNWINTDIVDEATSLKIAKKSISGSQSLIACSGLSGSYNSTFYGTFDNLTGEIVQYSNSSNLLPPAYSVEFSPNGKVLYALSGTGDLNAYTFDSSINIINTTTIFEQYETFKSLQLSPDNLITITNAGNHSAGLVGIVNPDSPENLYSSVIIDIGWALAAMPQLVPFHNIPLFNAISPICYGSSINPLPNISANGITGTWSPEFNNTATTTYTFTPDNTDQSQTTSLIVTVNQIQTPTFTQVSPICSGSSLSLSNNSTNGIYGSWSPALNNTATTTYTFTPNTGQCANTTNMTIVVKPKVTPTFNTIAPICSGSSNPLSNDSTNTTSIHGTWSPVFNNTTTTIYTFIPNAGDCANTATMTIVVNPNVTPSFTQISPIYAGDYLALPTTSNNGVLGSWSPAFNNMVTTIYTFTANMDSCVATATATMTITVMPLIVPTFNNVTLVGNINYTLPTSSTNGISGSWSPSTFREGFNTYTFTPNAGQHAATVTKSFLLMSKTTIDALDDDLSTAPIIEKGFSDYYTTSIFDNDSIIFEGTVSSDNVTYTINSISPYWDVNDPFYPKITDYGSLKIHTGFTEGTYEITYSITSKNCPSDIDTAKATIVLGNQSTSRKAAVVQEQLSEKIIVYPNPSEGIYAVDTRGTEGDYNSISVYNMLGSEVFQSSINSKSLNKIDISNVAKGCYIARISGSSGSVSVQLIKQ